MTVRALFVVLCVVLLGGCPRGITGADRAALQDFRTVERSLLARAEELQRDYDMRLTDLDDFVKAIRADLVAPWKEMRDRLKLGDRKLGDDLRATLARYVDERQHAWESWAKWIEIDNWNMPSNGVNYHWEHRESTEAADKDRARIESAFVKLKLPPLPPMAPQPVVQLDLPATSTTPGAAFFLVDHSVVRLDDNGFQTIATEIDSMDVLPDGTMWACSVWHLVHWDGTKATSYKPKLPVSACAAAPDGSVWVLDIGLSVETQPDRLARFDKKTWKIVSSTDQFNSLRPTLIADRDGRLYLADDGAIYSFDKKWQRVEIPEQTSSLWLHHMFRGGDGRVWAAYQVTRGNRYPIAFGRLDPQSAEAPVYASSHFQIDEVFPSIDPNGAFTVLLPRSSMIAQAKKQKQLPLPVAARGGDRDAGGAFAVDGAGRMWLELVDGINVIDATGTRTVYPRGSVELFVEPVKAIAVSGAGPVLAPPAPVVTRTITGQLEGGKVELSLCADAAGECRPGLPHWNTTSDAEGNFTFEKVPRWKLEIYGLVGLSGEKEWREVETECCAGKAALDTVRFAQNSWIY